MIQEIDFDEKYTTLRNLIAKNSAWEGCLFETYGDELDYIFNRATATFDGNNHIWSWVEGEKGTYVVAGYRKVNVIGYLITREKWVNEEEIYKID